MIKRVLSKLLLTMLVVTALPAFAVDLSYTLNPTVSPKSMSYVEKGAKVTLDFGDTEVSITDDAAVTATPQKVIDDGYDVEYVADGDAVSLPLYIDSENTVCFKFDVDREAGTIYELKLLRGTVLSKDGEKANMVKSWKYYVAQEVSYTLNPTVSPKSMSDVEKGAKVTLSFADTKVTIEDDAVVTATPVTEVENGYDTEYVYGDPVELPLYMDSEGNVCFKFDVEGQEGDLFELKLARGTVRSEDGEKANMVKTWKYFLAAASPEEMEVKVINPGNEEVEVLSNLITVYFTSQPESIAEGATAELKNDETGKTYTGEISIPEYMEKAIKVKFDYGEDADGSELSVPGTYTFTIAAGTITDKEGRVNAEISKTWTVSGPIDINDIEYTSVAPLNESTMTALSSITITFPKTPTLTKKLGYKATVGSKKYDYSVDNNVVTIAISPALTEMGTYEVTLPAGAVYALSDGHGNKEVSLTYIVDPNYTSVESLVMNGEETVSVYNSQGICVMSNATIEDLRNLKSGLYIVNGKKIMKK